MNDFHETYENEGGSPNPTVHFWSLSPTEQHLSDKPYVQDLH